MVHLVGPGNQVGGVALFTFYLFINCLLCPPLGQVARIIQCRLTHDQLQGQNL